MKKLFVWLLMAVFAVSMAFMGIGCKKAEEAAAPVEEEVAVEEETAAPAEEEEVSEEEPVELVFWWWGVQDEPGLDIWLEETIEMYESEHPNVTINAVLQSTEELIPAFQTAAQARSGPDLEFFWAGISTMEPVFSGFLAPISDYWSEEELQLLSYPDELKWRGKTWAVSFYNSVMPIVYNKEIFSESGLDPENPPKTWDEFLDACEKIKDAGYIPFVFGGAGLGFVPWLEAPLGSQNLDSVSELIDVYSGKTDYTDLKYSEWLYKLEEMVKKGYINEDAHTLDIMQANESYFTVGEGAMAIMPSGLARTINEEILVDQVGLMYPPVYGDGKLAGKNNVWRKNIGITEWSPNKEVAADFLRLIATEERSNAMYDICKALPGSRNFDSSTIPDQIGQDLVAMLEYSYDVGTNAWTPWFIDSEGINTAGIKIFTGEFTAEEAAEFIQAKIDEWIEVYPEMWETYKDWADSYK